MYEKTKITRHLLTKKNLLKLPFIRRHVLYVINLICNLAETARREGIFALEKYIKIDNKTKKAYFIDQNKNRTLQRAEEKFAIYFIDLLMSGIDGETIINLADNLIEYSSVSKKTKLFMIFFSMGIIDIQAGQTPYMIMEYASSFLSIDDVISYRNYFTF